MAQTSTPDVKPDFTVTKLVDTNQITELRNDKTGQYCKTKKIYGYFPGGENKDPRKKPWNEMVLKTRDYLAQKDANNELKIPLYYVDVTGQKKMSHKEPTKRPATPTVPQAGSSSARAPSIPPRAASQSGLALRAASPGQQRLVPGRQSASPAVLQAGPISAGPATPARAPPQAGIVVQQPRRGRPQRRAAAAAISPHTDPTIIVNKPGERRGLSPGAEFLLSGQNITGPGEMLAVVADGMTESCETGTPPHEHIWSPPPSNKESSRSY